MNVLHILATAGTGGIESLCRDYSIYSENNNIFVALWGVNGASAKAIKENGSIIIELNSNKSEILKVLFKLSRVVKRYSVDAIVVHHAAPIIHIYMHLLKTRFGRGIKTIAYAHGVAEDMCRHNDKKGLWIRKKVLSISLKRSMTVIAISEMVKSSIVRYLSVSADKITVIYNGTDISRFTSDIYLGFHLPVRLIYVGRLVKEKGVQTTLQAISRLPKNLKWEYDIVGDGAYLNNLKHQVKKLGLTEKVHFLGAREDIPELLREHDIFIHMPVWEEGFGITVIEAMASGLLCICLDKGGIPEIITNCSDGLLVHSKEELTNVLEEILSESDKYSISTIREKAEKRAKEFSIERFTRQLDDLILGKIKERKR